MAAQRNPTLRETSFSFSAAKATFLAGRLANGAGEA